MTFGPPVFTAAQLATALGCAPQAIRQRLDGIPGQKSIAQAGDMPALAWPFASLPSPMQAELEKIAADRGYRNAFALLIAPAPAWQPKVPISQADPASVTKAVKLQAVIMPMLARLDQPASHIAGTADLARYQKEFGKPTSLHSLRRHLRIIIDRDAGARAWHRVELYLDDRAGRPQPSSRASLISRERHRPLQDVIDVLENKAQPTVEDRAWLWHEVFTHYERAGAEHPGKREGRLLKTGLLDWLLSAVPGLSKTSKALRTSFETKLRAWREGGRSLDALRDKRPLASGKFRKLDLTPDAHKIRDLAILHGGNESLAHRLLRKRGELSPEFTGHYSFDERDDKSRVPAAVRQAITPQVDMCAPIHRGPWEAKMRGPSIPRDWSNVQPADWFSADDVTWNSYWFYHDETGKIQIARGECLLMIDLRTGYILDYLLIAGHYSSRHIRQLILRVHDKAGLPHVGFYFERGVWKARLIEQLDNKNSPHWRETEIGLKERGLGLDVRHATTPRAKTIEGIIRILQESQRNEPGFIGLNERTQEMERMQEKLARARRGTLAPETFLLSMDQWARRLDALFEEYNSEPQNGKMLEGSSPAEAWRHGLEQKICRKLPDNARYLLATHCRPVKVRQNGIILTVGKEQMTYCNEQTGALIGREVLAWYNVELPGLLTVSDLNRQNYFAVKRLAPIPAMSATKDQFADAHRQIADHRRPAATIYGNIKHPALATIARDAEQDSDTLAVGAFHNQAVADHETDQAATTRKLRKVHRTAAAAGVALPRHIPDPDRAEEALRLRREALEAIAGENQ